jgi:hypothetical protein
MHNIITSIFLISFLLIPQKNYYFTILSYIFLSFLFFIIFSVKRTKTFFYSRDLFYFILLFYILFIFTTIRYFLCGVYWFGIKEYIDLGRFLPFFLCFLIFYGRVNDKIIFYSFSFVGFLDFLITFSQFFKINFWLVSFAFKIYNLDGIYYWLFESPIVRAPGIFPGYGEHGLFLVFSLVYFIYYFKKYKNKLSLLLILFSFISILMNQSRTIFIALLLSFIIFLLLEFFKEKKFYIKAKYFFFIIFMITLVYLSYFYIKVNFPYLFSFFDEGIEAGSFIERKEIWKYFLSHFSSNSLFVLIGVGRELVGDQHSVYDNDFIFNFATYGIFGTLMLYLFYFKIFINAMKKKNIISSVIVYLVLFLSISSLGYLTFIQPHAIIMFMSIYFIKNKEKMI